MRRAKALDAASNLVWLQPAPANNTWAIAVRPMSPRRGNLATLDDFGRWVASGGKMKVAASAEFTESAAALPAFEKAYGFKLSGDQVLVLSGGDTAATEQAAASGTSGVNAAMAYGTDGQLAALGLVVMRDTKNVQLVFEPAPLIRKEVLDANPEIAGLLEPVFKSLTLETLQKAQCADRGRRRGCAIGREELPDREGFPQIAGVAKYLPDSLSAPETPSCSRSSSRHLRAQGPLAFWFTHRTGSCPAVRCCSRTWRAPSVSALLVTTALLLLVCSLLSQSHLCRRCNGAPAASGIGGNPLGRGQRRERAWQRASRRARAHRSAWASGCFAAAPVLASWTSPSRPRSARPSAP